MPKDGIVDRPPDGDARQQRYVCCRFCWARNLHVPAESVTWQIGRTHRWSLPAARWYVASGCLTTGARPQPVSPVGAMQAVEAANGITRREHLDHRTAAARQRRPAGVNLGSVGDVILPAAKYSVGMVAARRVTSLPVPAALVQSSASTEPRRKPLKNPARSATGPLRASWMAKGQNCPPAREAAYGPPRISRRILSSLTPTAYCTGSCSLGYRQG
jgi:hypothetical protein